jgi:hypothetical protein
VVRKRRCSVTALAVLASALVALLALPAFAAAIQTYKVENNGDAGTKALCEAHITNECTLRGALEAAEADPGFDLIEFASADFHGEVGGSEIVVGSTPLPTITQPLLIFGHPVFGVISPTIASPGVGVTAAVGQQALKVASAGVTIENMAFGNGKVGIEVVAPTTGLNVRSSWFGLKLDASANAIGKTGILLGPEADEATIGGSEESERNVFAHAEVGVQIEGASKTKVLGNYIGVGPAGTAAAGLENGVRIADAVASPAEENEVGGILTGPQVGTAACDGACNAIATEPGEGIDLAGSTAGSAASGPTTIRGNYLGLAPSGVGAVGENADAVRAAPPTGGCSAGPGDVSVGGPTVGETNYIAGGIFGIYAEAAQNFSAIGNAIGVGPTGAATESPQATGIGLCDTGVTEPALVAGNRMVLGPDTNGIESAFGQAQIVGNSIEGSQTGIRTEGAEIGGGNVITTNTITEPDTRGIDIEDDLNVVTGNTIIKAGRAGIQIETGADHNRIGGDAPGEANTIIETLGQEKEDGAITMFGEESGRNEFAANTGFSNPGAFIKLLPHGGAERPNGGIQPPVLGVVRQSSATGTADAGATVRIFSKASAEPGELGALLAKVVADGSGAWSATYATQPTGTLVAATQTSNAGTAEAGTSAVGAPTAASADPAKPEEPGGGGGQPPATNPTPVPTPPPPAPKAPKVKIVAGPKKSSTSTTAKFRFKAEPAARAKFECKLDGGKWAKCTPPKTYKKLKVGRHTFRVRAIASGLTGAVAKYQFTVKA